MPSLQEEPMRFIVVTFSKPPPEPVYCGFCTTALGKAYVRDLTTRILYHSHFCLELHLAESQNCIEMSARRTC